MIIQSSYGALAYSGISVSSAQRQEGRTMPAAIAAPAKNADQVSLSAAGKTLAASAVASTQARTPAQEKLMMGASSDRASADKIAYDMAMVPSAIVWDISGQRGVGDGTGEFVRKLATTGQIVGDDYIDRFSNEASVIDMQRRTLYETEKAKGTDPLQILSMMIDFTNAQSQDYLEATGWLNHSSTAQG